MSNVKRFKLTRVGAGPGVAVFTCEQLLGAAVEVIDAADYDAVAADAARYRYLREHPDFNVEKVRLEWYLPRYFGPPLGEERKTLAERLDDNIDEAIKQSTPESAPEDREPWSDEE